MNETKVNFSAKKAGLVRLDGDRSFDCDEIKNDHPSQWRWISYPESRMVVNPGNRPEYGGGMELNIGILSGAPERVDNIQRIKIGKIGRPAEEWGSCRTAWCPYKLTANAEYKSGAKLHTDEFFADKDTFVRLYDIASAEGQSAALSGEGADISLMEDCAFRLETQTCLIYCRVLQLDSDGRVQKTLRPEIFEKGWKVVINVDGDSIKLAFALTLLPKNKPGAGDGAKALCGKLEDKLTATKVFWNKKLRRVPAPELFGIQGGLDPKETTPAQHKRAFYAAWSFLYQNIIEPMPENGYPYYQVTLGKASMWPNGSREAPNSCAWESMFCIQQLALVEPKIAWDAAAGFIDAIDDNGILGGECLPSQKAHMTWVCYQNLRDEKRLAAFYPRIKKYLLWRAANPRWIFENHDFADEKDISFVTQWYSDVRYAIKICEVLGLDGDIIMWKKMMAEMGENCRKWFFTPAVGDPEDKIYNTCFADSRLHYNLERTEDVENYICSALYADLPPDLMQKLINHYVKLHDSTADLCGFDFYKYGDGCNIAYGLYSHRNSDPRLRDMWKEYINSVIRNLMKTVEFSEECRPDKYFPQGVTPSSFGASAIIDFTYMNNRVRFDSGLPEVLD